MDAALNKSWRTVAAAFLLFVLLITSLTLLVGAVLDVAMFDRYHFEILIFNIALLLLLIALWLGSIVKLIYQRIKKKSGARLTARLVLIFVSFAALPAISVYSVSLWMNNEGMKAWLPAGIENALGDALALSRYALDTQLRLRESQVFELIDQLDEAPADLAAYLINAYVRKHPFSELALFTPERNIVAAAGSRSASLLPDLPPDDLVSQALQERGYSGVDPIQKRGLYIRIVVPIRSDTLGQLRILQVLHPLSNRANIWAVSVQQAYKSYDRAIYFRGLLQNNFLIILTLVLLLGTLYAGWVAIISARRLIHPIVELTDATHNIAKGKLNVQIDTHSQDEVGQLVNSFNEMARNLEQAHNVSVQSKRQLEEQNSYLDAVLNNTASGVLGLAASSTKIKTANPAADKIFSVSWQQYIGQDLFSITDETLLLQKFCEHVKTKMQQAYEGWEEKININAAGRYLALLCRGKSLADGEYVIIFHDITQVEQAQRETVWGRGCPTPSTRD